MTDQPSSGNRWEPSETQPIVVPEPSVPPEAPAPPPPRRAWSSPTSVVLVAIGLAGFLLSGVVGFAVGRAASSNPTDNTGTSVFQPRQNPGFGPGDGRSRDHDDGHSFGTQP